MVVKDDKGSIQRIVTILGSTCTNSRSRAGSGSITASRLHICSLGKACKIYQIPLTRVCYNPGNFVPTHHVESDEESDPSGAYIPSTIPYSIIDSIKKEQGNAGTRRPCLYTYGIHITDPISLVS
jgi:hypothetical protein